MRKTMFLILDFLAKNCPNYNEYMQPLNTTSLHHITIMFLK